MNALATIAVPVCPIDVDTVTRRPSVRDIVRTVADYYDVTRDDVLSHSNAASLKEPRHVINYLSTILTPLSYPTIAHAVNRDPKAIRNSRLRIEARLARGDEEIAAVIRHLVAKMCPVRIVDHAAQIIWGNV